ncbi:MAG: MFS transporter [Dehalococcoidia bacterium]
MSAGYFERHPSMRALRYRDFRLLLAGSTLVGIVMPLQFLTQVFWVQEHYESRSVLYTALIAGSRGLAMLLFSLIGGAIADRFERRRVLLVCETASMGISAIVAMLMLTNPFGEGTIVAVCVFSFAASGVMSIDQPARQAAIPAIVGMESLGNAVSLNSLAMQMTLPLSLPLVGLLNAAWGPGEVYFGSLLAYAMIIPLIWLLRFRSVGTGDRRAGMLGNIAEGLRYSWRDPTIFGVIALLFVIQVVGMPGVGNPLGPVWMTEILGLSKAQFGFMAMTWGIGAMLAAVAMARIPGLTQRGSTLCVAAASFGVGMLLFGYSRSVPLTVVANFTLGAAFATLLVTSATVIQMKVADEMRGRVLGLFPLTLGLAQLNAAPVGAFGQWLGLPVIVPALGWLTLALCACVLLLRPEVRRLRPTGAMEQREAAAAASP